MKICPQCEKENPSSANCCMYCGAVLSEENLDENARLQRELNKANETITLLEHSLAVAHEHAKNQSAEVDKTEIQVLQTQLLEEKEKYQKAVSEKEKQWSYFNAQLTTVKKQKKSSDWGWIFVVLFVITGIVASGFCFENYENINRIDRINSKNEKLRNENANKSKENTNLENIISEQKEEIETLKKQEPQKYKIAATRAYCYDWLGGNFKNTNY